MINILNSISYSGYVLGYEIEFNGKRKYVSLKELEGYKTQLEQSGFSVQMADNYVLNTDSNGWSQANVIHILNKQFNTIDITTLGQETLNRLNHENNGVLKIDFVNEILNPTPVSQPIPPSSQPIPPTTNSTSGISGMMGQTNAPVIGGTNPLEEPKLIHKTNLNGMNEVDIDKTYATIPEQTKAKLRACNTINELQAIIRNKQILQAFCAKEYNIEGFLIGVVTCSRTSEYDKSITIPCDIKGNYIGDVPLEEYTYDKLIEKFIDKDVYNKYRASILGENYSGNTTEGDEDLDSHDSVMYSSDEAIVRDQFLFSRGKMNDAIRYAKKLMPSKDIFLALKNSDSDIIVFGDKAINIKTLVFDDKEKVMNPQSSQPQPQQAQAQQSQPQPQQAQHQPQPQQQSQTYQQSQQNQQPQQQRPAKYKAVATAKIVDDDSNLLGFNLLLNGTPNYHMSLYMVQRTLTESETPVIIENLKITLLNGKSTVTEVDQTLPIMNIRNLGGTPIYNSDTSLNELKEKYKNIPKPIQPALSQEHSQPQQSQATDTKTNGSASILVIGKLNTSSDTLIVNINNDIKTMSCTELMTKQPSSVILTNGQFSCNALVQLYDGTIIRV